MSDQSNILPVGENYYSKIIFKEKFEYNPLNIISIVVKEFVFEFLPTVELILKYDPSIFEQYALEDNDIFTIYLSNSPSNKNVFKIDCMIHDYKISVVGDDRAKAIQITGIIKCKNMFILQTKSYPKKTSKDVLIDVAINSGLNLSIGSISSQIGDLQTNDRMTWYQLNQNNYDFIKHVLKRAYVHDDCPLLYGDHNGDLIYTTINKEINKKEGKIAKFSVENFSDWQPPDNDTTIWYNSYEIINLQGTINKETNYGVKNEYYNLISESEVSFSKFIKMTDYSFIDKTYRDEKNPNKNNVFNYYGGIYNSKNMYSEKYFESYVRNYFLRNNLFGMSVEINVNSFSEINLFDKILLNINSQNYKVGNDSYYSGVYLVTGIIYTVSMNGIFQKRVYLSRNGYNKPDVKNFIARNY